MDLSTSSALTRLAASATALERWLIPTACVVCRSATADDALVCSLCRSRWRRVSGPWCDRCGQPTLLEIDCRLCTDWPEGFTTMRSAVWLEGGARETVHALKYGGWPRIAEAMALACRGLEPMRGAVTLVPVPLGSRRLRRRGYNQAEVLADAIGRATGLSVTPSLLRRRRETRSQTALAPDARAANVANAFSAHDVLGRRVVLVDDVFTTGATLAACAAASLDAGAQAVAGITFARAPLALGDAVATLAARDLEDSDQHSWSR